MLPDWVGQTVAVVAGGQSSADLAPRLRGRVRTVVVNLAFRLVPEADVLYAADSGFWLIYADARDFRGVKVSADERAKLYCKNAEAVEIAAHRGRKISGPVRSPVGRIGDGGGNSGFQAVNLIAQSGAARILLCGFDFRGRHWHPDHPPQLRNPSERQLQQWRATMDDAAPVFESWGVEVINLSPCSALTRYEVAELDRYIAGAQPAALQA